MRHVGNGDLNYVLQILKVCKHCKSDIHSVRHVGNDDLNYVGHSEHDAHHHRRNFEKVKVQNKQELRKV